MNLQLNCYLEYQAYTDNIPLITLLRLRQEQSQNIENETIAIKPNIQSNEYLDLYGNYCQRFLVPKGKFIIETLALVNTAELPKNNQNMLVNLIQDLPENTLVYLLPSRYCESDKLYQKALEIAQGLESGFEIVQKICGWVHENIIYKYNKSNSSTSALDTLAQGEGVCRDLSHLAIALCRTLNIPARFVVGYLYNLQPMDLHAWFEVYLGNQWYTFDATQNISNPHRMVLAYGRDAADVATATYFGDMKLIKMNVAVTKLD